MKTKIAIFSILLSVFAAVMFFSCDNPTFLGTLLDIEGPIVTIDSPAQRQSVPVSFELEGTVWDNSGVERMIIKAVNENTEFPRQWRYQNNTWEISNDSGKKWSKFDNAVWEPGTNNVISWKIHVDMEITGVTVNEGEYTFNVQAWDKGGFTDDNSFKAVVLIVDLSPPKVDISYPYLYRGYNAFEYSPLLELHKIGDNGDERQKPEFLGKFITQEFELKWQVEDINDVWSIDLRFYNYDTDIDNDPATPLPQDYFYKFNQNIPPVPLNANPLDYIKPNGSVIIPDLTNPAGFYDQGGEIKNSITEKTTLKIVAVCYDAAGNPNQEKTLGYLIYWPKANLPWIAFPDEMKSADTYYNRDVVEFEDNDVLTVFPSKYIKVTAYQAHGVKKIDYEVYSCAVDGVTESNKGKLTSTLTLMPNYSGTKTNAQYAPGMYTNIFTEQFDVPNLTGYYVVKATAYSNKDKPSEKYEMLFRVNDITFPDFPMPVQPIASESLFYAIDNLNEITISGLVGDVTEIETLCLVWINPESENYKAMNQLAYFREKNYRGWLTALRDLNKGQTKLEIPAEAYDPANLNRLWKLNFESYNNKNPKYPDGYEDGIDPDTNRRVFYFEQKINLSDLNIGAETKPTQPYNPLKSQIFLLRAENPAKRCTIITYAPQGDTVGPEIKIETVILTKGDLIEECKPNQSALITPFKDGNKIEINGTWKEDSMANTDLDIIKYFKNNFVIYINNKPMLHMVNKPSLTLTRNTNPSEGEWTITTYVGTGEGLVPLSELKDNLVIDVKTKDIGGNEATLTNSWIIQSDHLALNRISSSKPDGTYITGEQIEIFLEFNKPVNLATGVTGNLDLILTTSKHPESSTEPAVGYARYQRSNDQNSRQTFIYTVTANQNTVTPEYLNVKGLRYTTQAGVVTTYDTTTPYDTTNYPFRWTRGGSPTDPDSNYEEIRLTMASGKDGKTLEGVTSTTPKGYYVRTLPTANSGDVYTLISGKHISIDTFPPYVKSVYSNSPQRWYNSGDIFITVEFSEPVKLGTPTPPANPRLNLQVGSNTSIQTTDDKDDITVNGKLVTFRYNIGSSHTSNGNLIAVTGYTGTGAITDIAGNPLPQNAISGSNSLTGIYVETNPPSPPRIRLFSQKLDDQINDNNVIRSNVSTNSINNTVNYGSSTSSTGARNLVNVYENDLWLSLEGQGSAYQYDAMEYSFDNGDNWLTAPNTANKAFQLTKTPGIYTITARQKDKAGNYSTKNLNTIIFNWDPGNIISRVSSDNANGTYTHTTGRNEIIITVYFRKPVCFAPSSVQGSGNANIRINVKRGGVDYIDVPANPAINRDGNTLYNSLTFKYTVVDGDTTDGANLDIISDNIAGTVAHDSNTTTRVRLSDPNILTLPAGSPKLDKQLKVETGQLSQTGTLTFKTYSSSDNDTSNAESNDKFHGIRSDDGSYWTTLLIPFNHAINKGTGKITITQSSDGYRLPAVITEAQYNRLRNVDDINIYYVKGTNGADSNGASDTTTKYVLQYKYDPNSTVTSNNAQFTGNTPIPSAFFTAFRNAEAINVNVNAQAVSVDDKTLKIRLTGSSAPQVPGTTYIVEWEAGIVTDNLGNSISKASSTITADNPTNTSKSATLAGVAKPFIRIKKTQDTITVNNNPSMTQPRLVAAQPFLANARIDCRTPGSTITYTAEQYRTSLTGVINSSANSNNNWAPSGTAIPNNTNNTNNNNTNMLGTRPGNATANTYSETTAAKQITLGENASGTVDIDNVQGYQWWARARAGVGTTYSTETEEVANRTVITYQLRNATAAITGTGNRSILTSGDQIWIRGGNAISSSSIPGFPLTWDDDWDNLTRKRAGVRLMTMVLSGAGTSTNFTANKATTGTDGTNNVYTGNQTGWPTLTSNTEYNITVNGTQYIMYLTSNTNRTFRVYNPGTNHNNGAVQGLNVGGNNTSFTLTPNMNLNNSLWRLVSWDINATAYLDFIRGRDSTSSANEAWQYGPRELAYQSDGWTSVKNDYPAYAGKHRWCDTGYNHNFAGGTRGAINFSGTFMTRPVGSVDPTWTELNQP
jgi:hypothetical protein